MQIKDARGLIAHMRAGFLVSFAGLLALGVCVLSVSPLASSEPDPALAERLQQIRNLGKAFYENPGTQQLAVDELLKALKLNPQSARERLNYGLALLRAGQAEAGIAEVEKAREMDPAIPHTYFNLGVEFKRRGETERAISEFEQMLKLVPNEAKVHYNLGVLWRQRDELEKARASFERAAELDPTLAAPHFQLFNLLRRQDPARAKEALAEFQRLKALQDDASKEDVDWSFYSELYDPIDAPPPADEASTTEFRGQALTRPLRGQPQGLLVLDADADRQPDLLAWSSETLALWLHDGASPARPSGPEDEQLQKLTGVRDVTGGDYNNDGFPDLAAVDGEGAVLLENQNGSFTQPPRRLAGGDFRAAAWVDYDHDYDLDLLLAGAQQVLLRNNGDGTFLDVSDSFPFRKGTPALAVAVVELEEDAGHDIVIAHAGGVTVYEDRKLGKYEPRELENVWPGEPAARVRLGVADLDNDGFLDIAVTSVSESGAVTRILENDDGRLKAGREMAGAAAFADTQNRGWLDALGSGELLFNRGGFEFEPLPATGLATARLVDAAAADFNGDGMSDFAVLQPSGEVRLLLNHTAVNNSHVTVTLGGVKNRKLAEGARVEVKAGRIYGKQVYQGAPLVFGLAGAKSVDTVRITWPNGLIQNETRQETGKRLHYVEKPRLSGSCPMVFTWNGREFEFISEVLGVAPLGASLGGGEFFPVDHDEYVWIPAESLVARNSTYEIRITEELREVAYLDQVKLVAVDHPAGVEIFTNEKFKGPPFPEFRLFGVTNRQYPATAVDQHGHDVLERILKRDRRYPDDFERDFAGRAEPHSITLDFPQLAGAEDFVLFLHGWVDWADASTFVGTAQSEAKRLFGPYLEVRDSGGTWVKAVEDMGLPAGRARTIAVDLSGKFLSDSREVRIVTNMCLYWDEVFATAETASPEGTLTEIDPRHAELRFRGFSHLEVHPQRKQPESYDYARVLPASMWNPAPGNYTRYGDVRELLTAIDDRFVVMGAGDELALRFSAAGLPKVPKGWKRDFLLFVDGWAKETEANTAFGQSVEPLPFHAMKGYPYGPGQHYPDGPVHEEYLRQYNNRPALRLIRPLKQR